MSAITVVTAEFRKAVTLTGIRIAAAVLLVAAVALTVLNAVMVRNAVRAGTPEMVADTSPFEAAVAAPTLLGSVGAVVIGVLVISSEYASNSTDAGGGRQITATLTAIPGRSAVLGAKVFVIITLVAAFGVVLLGTCLASAQIIVGPVGDETVGLRQAVLRCLGSVLYWALTGLMAFAITVVIRNGIVPLIVLIVNNSLVSFSLVLTMVTDLAHWLPDMAGRRLFGNPYTVEGGLSVLPGALVMIAWTVGLLTIAAVVFHRRDA